MTKKEMQIKLIDIRLEQISVFLKATEDKQVLLDETLNLILKRHGLTQMEWFEEMGL